MSGKGFDVRQMREALGGTDDLAGIARMRSDKGIPSPAPQPSPPSATAYSPSSPEEKPPRRLRDLSEQERAEVLRKQAEERARLDAELADQERRALALGRLRASGIPDRFNEDHPLCRPWEPLPDDAERRIFDSLCAGRTVLLVGAFGIGKTRTLCHMARRWIVERQKMAHYMTLREYLSRRCFDGLEDPDRWLRIAKHTSLLCLDEADQFGSTPKAIEYVTGELFQIFDFRYASGLPMLIAANTDKAFCDLPGDTQRRGAAMTSRLEEAGDVIDVSGWENKRGAKE